MKRTNLLLFPLGVALFLCLCYSGTSQSERLASVGGTLITQSDANAFGTVARFYPNPPEEFSLASRPTVSGLVEAQAIYNHEQAKVYAVKLRLSPDWQWKERYYLTYFFMQTILQSNLGFTDDQLRNYYDNHQKAFSSVVQKDSAGKNLSVTVVPPFEEVKPAVADSMFLAVHHPDSTFLQTLPTKETAMADRAWLRFIHEGGYRDYFMNLYYKEQYGTTVPDSLKDFCGKGKLITPEDIAVIISWLPPARRSDVRNNQAGLRDFALWLVRWKLFAGKAADLGIANKPEVRDVIQWAWRFEIAQRYITGTLAAQATKGVTIDSAMAAYAYRDESGSVVETDSAQLKKVISKLVDQESAVKMDSLVYELRRGEKVQFLKKEWCDELVKDPAKLLRRADSLRDTGNTSDAQLAYGALVDNFFFTGAGKKALLERAKIKTEQQLYTEAIRDYRRALVTRCEKAKNCNTMFMIGFIYDEYLTKPDMAEINYKWVLKNTPGCELTDDAEFMMQHLGEQMASVDELQAEVKRQGKKIETGSPADSSGLKVQ